MTNKEETKNSHWNGDEYNQISLPQSRINQEFLNYYSFLGNEHILDIGCGSSQTTRDISIKVPNGMVLGIDSSENMIFFANKLNKHPNLTFETMDAQSINFINQFDLVTSFFCMQWVKDKLMTFEKIYDALKISGEFLMIATLPHPQLPKIRLELIQKPSWKKYFTHYSDPLAYINDSYYKSYAEKAGFVVKSYYEEEQLIIFSTYTEFFSFMKQMTPHISQLPHEEKKNEFIHQLLEAYTKFNISSIDGSYKLTFNLAKMIAYKN